MGGGGPLGRELPLWAFGLCCILAEPLDLAATRVLPSQKQATGPSSSPRRPSPLGLPQLTSPDTSALTLKGENYIRDPLLFPQKDPSFLASSVLLPLISWC